MTGWFVVAYAALAEMDGYVTTDDGLRLYFQTVGNGAIPLVIPNGLATRRDLEPLAVGRQLLFYDVRNRGRSDSVTDPARLTRGILNDVSDLDAVRRHFDLARFDLLGHSYIGLMVALSAAEFGANVHRVVQIGPIPPSAATKYPAHLTCADGILAATLSKIADLQKDPEPRDPEERCRKFWAVLRAIYVTDPANADRIDWGRCELPNERMFMKYWMEMLLPSIQRVTFSNEDAARVTAPVLVIHGRKDRSTPYGGGRDWARTLPDARLVTIDEGGHAPWIEAPEQVFGAIETFLAGEWPADAEIVTSVV